MNPSSVWNNRDSGLTTGDCPVQSQALLGSGPFGRGIAKWVGRDGVGWLAFVLLIAGCSRPAEVIEESAPSEPTGPLIIFADNYPVAYFAERLAGPLATVTLPVPEGRDPAYWQPDDETVVKLQSADLILLNGADFSKWTNTTTLPMAKVVNTSRHFADRFIMMEGAVVHRHGPEGEHSHVGLASFTWLDPEQALEQALEIALALKKHRPSAAGEIDERWKSLEKDLHALRDRLTSMAAVRKEPLLASHPLYEYLGRFLGWDLTSYHWEPKEMPSDEEWKGLESHLAKKPTRWMIWEAPPADEIAQRLVALGVQPVVFDCATHRPATGDYMTVMNQNAENLRRVYEYEPDGDATPSEKAEGDAAEGSE